MKHIYLFLMTLFIGSFGFAQTTVTYEFSSGAVTGLNESSPGITVDTNIGFGSFKNSGTSNPALNSGQLRLYQNATKGGSIIIYANNGATITNVVVNASGTTGPAGYTVDNGTAVNLNASTTYTISSISGTSEVEFYQRSSSSSNRIYVDSFEVTYTMPATCTAPTTQASLYNTTALGTTSATLNWTPGNGDEVLVLVKEGSTVDTDPDNGTAYTGNTTFTSGDQIGTGNYAVYSGSTTSSVGVTGLNPSTTYHVAVYEYNTIDTCYELTELTGDFTTGCSTPSDVSAFTATEGNTIVDLSWTNGTCFDQILVVAKAGSAVTNSPSGDGTAYTADATFGSGTDLGSSEFVVYKGSGTSVSVTGLTNGTTYHFEVFARKATTWSTGVTDNATPDLTYCDPNPSSVDGIGITNVTLGTINNTTGTEVGNYGDYSAQSTDVSQEQMTTCAITYNTGYTYVTKIWVDYNDDGDFDDTDEEVYSGTSTNDEPTTLNANFTIPISAPLGQHRLRIGGADSGPPTPCYIGAYASYEDYTINVIAALNNDSDTEVYDPTSQVGTTTITAASSTTSGTAFDAFGFEVEDLGTADGLPTNITTMRFVPGPNNTADWTDHIQGVTLLDGNVVSYTPTTSITDTEIVLTFGSPIEVADSSALEFLLGLYLNTTAIVDGSVIQLQIDEVSGGFDADANGSDFANSFFLGDVVGNNITIDVDVTEIVFSQQPSDTELNAVMTPSVTVSGVDANGNLDTGYSLDVEITSTGTLTGTPVTETAVDGIATFTTLTHTVAGFGLVLTADDGALSTIDSTPFDITEPIVGAADLFFSEYVEGDTGNNKYLEIYNGTGTTITLTDYSVEMYSNGSSSVSQTEDFTIGFPTTLNNGEVIVLQAQNTSEYSGIAYSSNVCFFNGDDTVVLKKNGITIDIIGNMGCDPGSAFTATGGYSTANQTLIRNIDVCEGVSIDPSGCGSTSFTTLATEWTTLGTDVFSNLGSHTAMCGAPVTYTYNGTWLPSDPNGVATASDDIVITTGDATISSNTSINTVTVNPGASLTIDAIATLTVADNFTLESVSNSYSSLILDGTITGTVNYSRHINTTASTTGNDLISAPLTGQTFTSFVAANSNIVSNSDNSLYLFGPFEKPTNEYITYGSSETATLDPAIGYRAASTDDGNFIFTGTVNKTDKATPIVSSGTGNTEWNLIGNPYPSYITLSEFLAQNGSLFTIERSGVYGYDGDASTGWTIWNQAYSDFNSGALIAPGQGFLVTSKAAGGTVNFTTGMRSSGDTDDFIEDERSSTVINISQLKLQITNSTKMFNTDFYFNDTATLGLNPGYDSGLLGSVDDFALYSHLVEENTGLALGIQTLNNTNLITEVVIPLGVNANQGEQLTFSIAESTLAGSVNVYLEDDIANTSTLLTTGDYILTPNTNLSGTGRFFLRFTEEALSTVENSFNNLNIYTSKATKEIVVNGQLIENTICNIYDIQGRLVSRTQLNHTTLENRINISTVSTGIYIVKLQSNNFEKTQKLIIE